MTLQLVRDKRTGDYIVRSGRKQLGVLYEKDCETLGHCWAFDVKTKNVFSRDIYFYTSPELAKEWIPREIRNEKQERELYRHISRTLY